MTSRYPSQISQELLSAYIDGEVNTQEQRLVEQALTADPEIVWQVESLRHTVALLADLPAIALPQSFVLSEARVADVVATRRSARRQSASHTAPSGDNVWQKLFAFLGGGNLLLRNAAAVAAVAFFVLMAGDAFTGAPGVPAPQTAPAVAQAEVLAESAVIAESAEMPVVAEEMPAAKAMPASQDAAQDTEPAAELAAEPAAEPAAMSFAADATQPSPESAELIPDASPMILGAEPRTGVGVGGGGDGLGAGGGGEITSPQAAPAALAQSAPPAAEIQRVVPAAEAESASQGTAVGAAALSTTEMPVTPATPAPQAVAMIEPATEPVIEEEIAATAAPAEIPMVAPAPADVAQTASQSAPSPEPTGSPFAPLRLTQIGLALIALLLSGLWVRSK